MSHTLQSTRGRMRIQRPLKWLFAFGFLALAAGPAGAQPGTPPSQTPAAPPPPTEGQVGFQRKTSLTPQGQLTESGKHLSRMEGAASGVRKQLEEARRQRDVVKT